jgi:hypothetical protein
LLIAFESTLPLASGTDFLLIASSGCDLAWATDFLLIASESTLPFASGPNLAIASGMEVPIAYTCPKSGVILGRKTPKYNKTLRATATAPTTSTTLGLLSVSSNLVT